MGKKKSPPAATSGAQNHKPFERSEHNLSAHRSQYPARMNFGEVAE